MYSPCLHVTAGTLSKVRAGVLPIGSETDKVAPVPRYLSSWIQARRSPREVYAQDSVGEILELRDKRTAGLAVFGVTNPNPFVYILSLAFIYLIQRNHTVSNMRGGRIQSLTSSQC